MGCKILKRVSWPWPRSLQGKFFIGRVRLAMHGRPHIGANGVSWPPWKYGWKTGENMQKEQFSEWWGGGEVIWVMTGWSSWWWLLLLLLLIITLLREYLSSYFLSFLCLGRQRGIDPPNQNPADALVLMVSQCTKFEVSNYTHYEAMNGGAKCRKWGGLRHLGVTQGHRQCHRSIERIRLPIRL